MANNCKFYNSIVISFDVFNEKVVLYKCCYKHQPNEFITSYTVDEWSQLIPFNECEKYINDFGKQHDKSIDDYCKFQGAEKECFKENNHFERVCIYLNYDCNANCSFCTEYGLRRDYLKTHLDLKRKLKKLYFETIESFKGKGIALEFTCVGEPFLYKNDMIKFFKSCKKEDFVNLAFVSNGALLDEELQNAMEATEIPFFGLLSLNCVDEESYNEIMHLQGFEKVFNSILNLKNFKRLQFSVSFVIDWPSFKYLEKFERVFKELYEHQIRFRIYANAGDAKAISESEGFKYLLNLKDKYTF